LFKKILSVIILYLLLQLLIIESYAENLIYRSVSNENMQIALTFDDGPHPARTPEILKILNEYNVKATFFVIGKNVEYYPETFQKIISDGHEIGNHTYTHRSLKKCTTDLVKKEIQAFEKIISEYSTVKSALIRPPGGLYGNSLEDYAINNNYNIILWSVDTMDWAHKDVDEIVDNILTNTDGGDIILMHDYISGQSPTPKVIETVIPILIERGYEFVTVSELISKSTR